MPKPAAKIALLIALLVAFLVAARDVATSWIAGASTRLGELKRRALVEIDGVRDQGPPSMSWLIAALALVVVLLGSGQETPWRRAWFDLQHSMFPRDRAQTPAAVIAIDDRSLEEIGQWPWPRDVHARLLEAATAQGAVAVAFDILFAEPDRSSPWRLADRFEAESPETAAALRRLPDSDARFAEALARTYSVLPVSGANRIEGAQTGPPGFAAPPVIFAPAREGGATPETPRIDAYPELLRNVPTLSAAAAGHGAISVRLPYDGTVRRAPAIQRIGDRVYPFLSLEALRVALGASWIEVTADRRGPARLSIPAGEAEIAIPLERDGAFWPYFGRYDPNRYFSAADVLAGRAPEGALAGKVVFVGATAVALEDRKPFPIAAAPLPGVETHLQIVEGALSGAYLSRPPVLFWLETLGFVAAAVLFGWFIPRQKPTRSLVALGAALIAMMLGSLILFRFGALLMDAATPTLALALYAGPTLGKSLIETNRERRRAEAALAEERVNRARVEGELNAAKVIQMSLVPTESLAAPEHGVSIHGRMVPALQVGGDFYDYFRVEDDRLFFTIGDVSDKGVPAALFMALSKTLWKSMVLRDASDLGAIQARTNDEITRDNREEMFFTGLAGVMDLASGEVLLSSAGHDMPFLRTADGAVTQLEGENGLPMGVIDGMDYPTLAVTLAPGDMLFMFTDGVSEAVNPQGEFFELERIEQALREDGAEVEGDALIERIWGRVQNFADGAPQSDDVTILTLHRRAPWPPTSET